MREEAASLLKNLTAIHVEEAKLLESKLARAKKHGGVVEFVQQIRVCFVSLAVGSPLVTNSVQTDVVLSDGTR